MPASALLRLSRAALSKSLLVVSLHLLILFFALRATGVISRPASALPVIFLNVLSSAPEKPAQLEAQPRTHLKVQQLQVPVVALTASTHSPLVPNEVEKPALAATVAPTPAPSGMPVAESPALTDARFDAAYLNNPAPSYPLISRRNGEAGKVLLLVQVSKSGTAAQVEIAQSCGYARLDQAALEAVRQWRFIPARRGDEAVAASVLVPLSFRLNS